MRMKGLKISIFYNNLIVLMSNDYIASFKICNAQFPFSPDVQRVSPAHTCIVTTGRSHVSGRGSAVSHVDTIVITGLVTSGHVTGDHVTGNHVIVM